jgi:hypothetical protein
VSLSAGWPLYMSAGRIYETGETCETGEMLSFEKIPILLNKSNTLTGLIGLTGLPLFSSLG